ncbi:GNAT family N-acetyltransferase [Mucilaginibacter sp. SP1R1]|uniref:GNAT family N-acetyltransferase n=1 Tax=Mucilaginibacter sp. SP1R1 TaxID=2723091 RepID=UPI0016086D78|nr:GNAT family N-acetyltransferase [Mucilaginibacter sp. SP1R1]MBB6149523.1 GNAT superfamily N-acetyltransferase [Mucilaginibacter sp. SP1R1]
MENTTNQKLPVQGAGELNIRVAQQNDCPRLMELVHELALYEKLPDEVSVTLAEFEAAGFGTNPVWKAFVAQADGLIIGFAIYYIRYSTWKGCRMYLEDLIVTEAYRGKGVGKLLFNRLIAEAKELDYSGMVWQVLDWNEPALNFYKKYEASIESGWLNASLSREQFLNY